jgi:hypothetical protein
MQTVLSCNWYTLGGEIENTIQKMHIIHDDLSLFWMPPRSLLLFLPFLTLKELLRNSEQCLRCGALPLFSKPGHFRGPQYNTQTI